MQATCSSCSNVVTVDESNPKIPEGAFSVKCPKCQTAVRFPAKAARAAAQAQAEPEVVHQAEMAPVSTIPLKPTALPGERALVALDDGARAAEIARSLGALGYEVDILSDADGVRTIEMGAHVVVVMARTVAESGAFTCYQRLFLLNSDIRRSFFLILIGDEYTTGDGLQAFVVHGDLVIASPEAGSCAAVISERLIERTRLFRAFVDCRRKHEAAATATA